MRNKWCNLNRTVIVTASILGQGYTRNFYSRVLIFSFLSLFLFALPSFLPFASRRPKQLSPSSRRLNREKRSAEFLASRRTVRTFVWTFLFVKKTTRLKRQTERFRINWENVRCVAQQARMSANTRVTIDIRTPRVQRVACIWDTYGPTV